MSVDLFVTIKHLIGQFSVSRIVVKGQAIGHVVRHSTRQTNFVPIKCIPALFNNDVRVRFKDRDNFFT